MGGPLGLLVAPIFFAFVVWKMIERGRGNGFDEATLFWLVVMAIFPLIAIFFWMLSMTGYTL